MTTVGAAVEVGPVLDDDGLLRFRGHWVAVSRKEERLLQPLLLRQAKVVSREQLATEVWGDRSVPAASLNTLVQRLRRRIEPLGLNIESVRTRGFMLTVLAAATTAATNSEGLQWLIS